MAGEVSDGNMLHGIHSMKDFFLARQPILNREQKLVAYELLFRAAASGPANIVDDLSATAAVISHASEFGMEKVIGDSLGFINVDAAVLMSDFINILPVDKIVLEILETVQATPVVLARIQVLAQAGFTFALDDVIVHTPDVQKFLPLVDIIKIDVKDLVPAKLLALTEYCQQHGKKLLAEKVETQILFQTCLDLGFDYFQGYHFARPSILTGKRLAPSELSVMQLLERIASGADNAAIEHCFKQDASLGLNLLRLVNSPAFVVKGGINTIGQALMVLGRSQLQRWLQVLLYANTGVSGKYPSPLLLLATTRGKLLELMADKVMPGQRNAADIAFTVGIVSLMDVLFGLPMTDILKMIAVHDEVRDALLLRKGVYGDMLRLAESIEHLDEDGAMLLPTLDKLHLSSEALFAMQLTAFEWTNKISGASL